MKLPWNASLFHIMCKQSLQDVSWNHLTCQRRWSYSCFRLFFRAHSIFMQI